MRGVKERRRQKGVVGGGGRLEGGSKREKGAESDLPPRPGIDMLTRPRENHAAVRNGNPVSRPQSTKIVATPTFASVAARIFARLLVRNFSRGRGKGKVAAEATTAVMATTAVARRGWREEKPRIGQDAVVVRLARLHRVIDTAMVSAVSASSYSISASIVRRRSTRSIPGRARRLMNSRLFRGAAVAVVARTDRRGPGSEPAANCSARLFLTSARRRLDLQKGRNKAAG